MFCLEHFSLKCTIKDIEFKVNYPLNVLAENIFFIICFYAMMHGTIVQNKIISIICSLLFFVWLIVIRLV